jgi:hypothetical protein
VPSGYTNDIVSCVSACVSDWKFERKVVEKIETGGGVILI